ARADQRSERRLERTGSRQAADKGIEHHDGKTGSHRHDSAELGKSPPQIASTRTGKKVAPAKAKAAIAARSRSMSANMRNTQAAMPTAPIATQAMVKRGNAPLRSTMRMMSSATLPPMVKR